MLVANPKLTFNHPYPPTKLMFIPDREAQRPDLMATCEYSDACPSCDCARVPQDGVASHAKGLLMGIVLFFAAGDFLRVWQIKDEGVELQRVLDNSGSTEFCAPLTSFDWNEVRIHGPLE